MALLRFLFGVAHAPQSLLPILFGKLQVTAIVVGEFDLDVVDVLGDDVVEIVEPIRHLIGCVWVDRYSTICCPPRTP